MLDQAALHVVEAGEGTPVVLLHGLTATHRYVVMGSRALERSGHRVIAYDARGHGALRPGARPRRLRLRRPGRRPRRASSTSAGSSAQSWPARRWAPTPRCASRSSSPSASRGLVVITPAYDPAELDDPERAGPLGRAGRRACAAAASRASSPPTATRACPRRWRETVVTVLRQRLARPRAPRGRGRRARGRPALAPVRRDRRARGHRRRRPSSSPTATRPTPAIRWPWGRPTPRAIPGARLVVEEEGRSPIAWQGGQLSKAIAGLAAEAA